jgi:hypothetical protein
VPDPERTQLVARLETAGPTPDDHDVVVTGRERLLVY